MPSTVHVVELFASKMYPKFRDDDDDNDDDNDDGDDDGPYRGRKETSR